MFTNLAIKRGHHIVESTSYHQIHMKEVETSKSIQFMSAHGIGIAEVTKWSMGNRAGNFGENTMLSSCVFWILPENNDVVSVVYLGH